jgi:hypothetical protein
MIMQTEPTEWDRIVSFNNSQYKRRMLSQLPDLEKKTGLKAATIRDLLNSGWVYMEIPYNHHWRQPDSTTPHI